MLKDVRLHPDAQKYYFSLDKKERKKLNVALKKLLDDPFRTRPGVKVEKMTDSKKYTGMYKLKVGHHRAIFEIEEDVIWVTLMFYRGRGY